MSYVETEQLQKQINKLNLWTVQELCERRGVTPMTVYVWREKHGLPYITIKGTDRPVVRFVPKDVRSWERNRKKAS